MLAASVIEFLSPGLLTVTPFTILFVGIYAILWVCGIPVHMRLLDCWSVVYPPDKHGFPRVKEWGSLKRVFAIFLFGLILWVIVTFSVFALPTS